VSSNRTFDPKELELIHIALIKARGALFDATEIKFNRKSVKKPTKDIPVWKGKRGTCPLLDDLDRAIALMRLHINSEEALQLYDALGMFDQPKKEGPKPLSK